MNFLKPATHTAVCSLPPVNIYNNGYLFAYSQKHEEELSARQISIDYVLVNKVWRYVAFVNAFIYLVRYGVLDWAHTYSKQAKRFGVGETRSAYVAYEYARIPGTVLCGWLIDKIFKGRCTPATVIFMLLVLLAVTLYCRNNAGNPSIDNFPLITNGFLIYGLVMLICFHAPDLVRKKGAVADLTSLFGYLGGVLFTVIAMGYVVEALAWNEGFGVLVAACSIFFLSLTWKNKKTSSNPFIKHTNICA